MDTDSKPYLVGHRAGSHGFYNLEFRLNFTFALKVIQEWRHDRTNSLKASQHLSRIAAAPMAIRKPFASAQLELGLGAEILAPLKPTGPDLQEIQRKFLHLSNPPALIYKKFSGNLVTSQPTSPDLQEIQRKFLQPLKPTGPDLLEIQRKFLQPLKPTGPRSARNSAEILATSQTHRPRSARNSAEILAPLKPTGPRSARNSAEILATSQTHRPDLQEIQRKFLQRITSTMNVGTLFVLPSKQTLNGDGSVRQETFAAAQVIKIKQI